MSGKRTNVSNMFLLYLYKLLTHFHQMWQFLTERFNTLQCFDIVRGTGIRGLMGGMATLPDGNQELLVVKDKIGRPQMRLG